VKAPSQPGQYSEFPAENCLAKVVEDAFSFEQGRRVELVFNAKKLVIFADPVGAAEGTGFYLAGIDSHGKIGQGSVLGFS
jgi:hypothetical protein